MYVPIPIHKNMISLHPEALIKSQSLINVGAFLCVFPISLFGRVAEVNENLLRNELYASDLEDLIHLSKILIEQDQLSELLKQDIQQLGIYLNLKVMQFADIKKSCGRHTQYLGI